MQRCGEVIKTEEKTALVRVKMVNSCSPECENYGICKKHEEEVLAINEIGAVTGDTVTIETPDRPVLLFAFITFIIPLILCLFGAGAGYLLFGEAAGVIGGAIGLLLSLAVIIFTDKKLKRTEKLSVIAAITKNREDQASCD